MELDALPELDIVAGTNDDGAKSPYLSLTAPGGGNSRTGFAGLRGFRETTLYEITGNSYDDVNSVFQPDYIVCQESKVPAEAWRWGTCYDLHLFTRLNSKRAHSLAQGTKE